MAGSEVDETQTPFIGQDGKCNDDAVTATTTINTNTNNNATGSDGGSPIAVGIHHHLRTIIRTHRRTLRLFLTHPSTRTPSKVLYVASFGGALHAAVTTYFYLALGASEMEIGRFGFVMSAGALVGGPLCDVARWTGTDRGSR